MEGPSIIGKKFGMLEVIEPPVRKSRHTYCVCKCDCGRIKKIRLDSLKNGITKSCGCSSRSISKQTFLAKHNDLTNCKFGRWTVICQGDFKNSILYWLCRCDCGTERYVKEPSLLDGTSQSCGCLNREKIVLSSSERIKDLSGQKFGKLLALYCTDKKSRSNYMWHCVCDCGREKDVSGYNLSSGITKSCGQCSFMSAGEWKIQSILDENGVRYEKEKTFPTCVNPKTGAHYRFDFYVEDEYIIEYDGIQHFYTAGNKWEASRSLEQRREDDMFKSKWCDINKIPLIRVPYYDLDSLTISSLRLDTAKYLIHGFISEWAYLMPE